MNLITLNSQNYDNNNINKFVYKFKTTNYLKGKIALSSLILPYSTPNINDLIYFNNTFQIIYNGQTNNFIIPNGFYTLNDLNQYLQYLMRQVSNNIPYNSINGGYSYFLEFKYDTQYYSVKLYSYPAILQGTAGKPNSVYTNVCPQIKFNSNLSEVLGLVKDKLYPQISNYNSTYIISSNDENLVPNITPSNSYIMLSNVVNNDINIPSNILYSFTPNVNYGSNINIQPSEYLYLPIREGYYNELVIEFIDELSRKLYIKDKNALITLSIDSTKI